MQEQYSDGKLGTGPYSPAENWDPSPISLKEKE
jgi:hypothetical protein